MLIDVYESKMFEMAREKKDPQAAARLSVRRFTQLHACMVAYIAVTAGKRSLQGISISCRLTRASLSRRLQNSDQPQGRYHGEAGYWRLTCAAHCRRDVPGPELEGKIQADSDGRRRNHCICRRFWLLASGYTGKRLSACLMRYQAAGCSAGKKQEQTRYSLEGGTMVLDITQPSIFGLLSRSVVTCEFQNMLCFSPHQYWSLSS